ncbi:MAG: CDP-alcohol phosphatidyltransferase family protein [Patescibacteria group bacterium]
MKNKIDSKKQSGEPLNIFWRAIEWLAIEKGEYFTVANIISYLRAMLAYPLYTMLDEGAYLAAFITFMVATATDFIDGHVARGFEQISETGKNIDPMADKIMLIGPWFYLKRFLPDWLWWSISGIEMTLFLMAAILKRIISHFGIKRLSGANDWGKIKFSFEVGSIAIIIIAISLHSPELKILSLSSILYAIGLTSLTTAIPFGLASIIEHTWPGLLTKIHLYFKKES